MKRKLLVMEKNVRKRIAQSKDEGKENHEDYAYPPENVNLIYSHLIPAPSKNSSAVYLIVIKLYSLMQKALESKLHLLEMSHWWFAGRRDMVGKLIRNANKSSSILDLGCAGGSMILFLNSQGFRSVSGIDISPDAISICSRRKAGKVSMMDARNLELPQGAFDMVVASDILEHIDKDQQAMKECFRVLKPGGKLVAFVPAFESLWSEHDVVAQHQRRYSKKEFLRRLRSAGFSIEYSSYWNTILFFPCAATRLLQRAFKIKAGDQLDRAHPFLNWLLSKLLHGENFFIQYLPAPVGLSVFAVARKPC
jgi:ubiquinone/menaquinone biosynthesis C-methylase UbiE